MLIRPSGKLEDSLGVLLHYPTYTTTSDVCDGQTFDLGSPCPGKLAHKGVPEIGCLWLDTYARRQDASPRKGKDAPTRHGRSTAGVPETPTKDWPEAQRAMHEEFSTWVVETS